MKIPRLDKSSLNVASIRSLLTRRKSATGSDLNALVTRYMPAIVYVVVGVAVGGYILKHYKPDPPQDFMLVAMKQKIQSNRAEIASLAKKPYYPSIWDSWVKTKSFFEQCGTTFSYLDKTSSDDLYQGPVLNWTAEVKGPPPAVLSCLIDFPQTPIVRYGQITVTNETASALISVLGRQIQGIHQP